MPPSPGRRSRIFARLLLTALVLWFIGGMTLGSANSYPSPAPFFCLLGCSSQEIRDLVSNIVLFIPLGWVLRYWCSPRLTLLLCVVATLSIEATQAFVLIGRDPSLRDILTNAAGGWMGLWVFDHWERIVRSDRAMSARLAQLAVGSWIVLLLLTGLGLHPAGSSYPWFGMWANDLESYARFDGTLESVELNGWVPPAGEMPRDNPLDSALRANHLSAHIVAVNGEVTGATALIFSVNDQHDNEMFFIGGARRRIQMQVRTRFDAWGLRGLSMRLPLDGSQRGDTMDIRAAIQPDRWELSMKTGSEQRELTLPLTVGLGWATLFPMRISIAYDWYVLNVLWLATFSAPVAYYLYRWRRREGIGQVVGLVLVPVLVIPFLLGIGASRTGDWIGSISGVIFGMLVAQRSLTRHPRD